MKEDAEEKDREAIRAVISTYQEAGKQGSKELYSQVFHPQAVVCYPSYEEGSLVTTPIDVFASEVIEMVEAGQTVEERTRGLEVVVAGNVASARVDFILQLGSETYEGTDFMSLAKLRDRWLITHKLYDMVPLET